MRSSYRASCKIRERGTIRGAYLEYLGGLGYRDLGFVFTDALSVFLLSLDSTSLRNLLLNDLISSTQM